MKLTPENCKVFSDVLDERGLVRPIVRIASEGFGTAIDDNFEQILKRNGYTLIETRESGTVGTWSGGMMTEYSYTTPDAKSRFAYLITTCGIDSWCQEWIVSAEPLDWHVAADLIQEARRIAYPHTYKQERES